MLKVTFYNSEYYTVAIQLNLLLLGNDPMNSNFAYELKQMELI